HPYTKALLQSIPRVQSESREMLASITGSIPHPYDRPSGCAFNPRCPSFIEGTCDVGEPESITIGSDHQVSCFLYQEG
ncbi:MAG: ABC transporter ATP-binding protein, partial [SAR202 cluster bacterium]|nr:ABC transporter ATP-binding protein [SAR202 cluster bacterium]